jgi:hypothetical protein
MKTIKMKTTGIFTAALALATITLTSCKNEVKNDAKNFEESYSEASENTNATPNVNLAMSEKTDRVSNIVTATSFQDKNGEEVSYTIDDAGMVHMDDWTSFSTLESELSEIKALKFKTTNEKVADLAGIVTSLKQTIPDALMTEEIMEDIDDIQKEYNELIAESDASKNEYMENLEELSEQFDDLHEEITETVFDYAKINKKAIDKYNKKMEKGKIEAAEKTYNKQMEKANTIADYDEK